MLAALEWSISVIGFAGVGSCIAVVTFLVWRSNIDPDKERDALSKFMAWFAACFGFFLVAIVGVMLLAASGAYQNTR